MNTHGQWSYSWYREHLAGNQGGFCFEAELSKYVCPSPMFSDIKRTKSRCFWQKRCVVRIKKNDEFDDATNTDGADHIPFEGRGKKRNDNFVKFTV